MATESLFGNKIKPACHYCIQAYQAMGEEQILCLKRGVVPREYSCKKFRYDPLKRVPQRPLPLIKYTEEDFAL